MIKLRMFEGVEYGNCDDYTEDEMRVIANWENASKEKRQAMMKKHGWKDSLLYRLS